MQSWPFILSASVHMEHCRSPCWRIFVMLVAIPAFGEIQKAGMYFNAQADDFGMYAQNLPEHDAQFK